MNYVIHVGVVGSKMMTRHGRRGGGGVYNLIVDNDKADGKEWNYSFRCKKLL